MQFENALLVMALSSVILIDILILGWERVVFFEIVWAQKNTMLYHGIQKKQIKDLFTELCNAEKLNFIGYFFIGLFCS